MNRYDARWYLVSSVIFAGMAGYAASHAAEDPGKWGAAAVIAVCAFLDARRVWQAFAGLR